jgi:hypothetical protein
MPYITHWHSMTEIAGGDGGPVTHTWEAKEYFFLNQARIDLSDVNTTRGSIITGEVIFTMSGETYAGTWFRVTDPTDKLKNSEQSTSSPAGTIRVPFYFILQGNLPYFDLRACVTNIEYGTRLEYSQIRNISIELAIRE